MMCHNRQVFEGDQVEQCALTSVNSVSLCWRILQSDPYVSQISNYTVTKKYIYNIYPEIANKVDVHIREYRYIFRMRTMV